MKHHGLRHVKHDGQVGQQIYLVHLDYLGIRKVHVGISKCGRNIKPLEVTIKFNDAYQSSK